MLEEFTTFMARYICGVLVLAAVPVLIAEFPEKQTERPTPYSGMTPDDERLGVEYSTLENTLPPTYSE